MTHKDEQLKHFREAVDRKSEEAEQPQPQHGRPPSDEQVHSQDAPSPRQKSSVHGKVTADKWNQ